MLGIEEDGNGAVAILKLAGRADSTEATRLETALTRRIDLGATHAILDLSRLDYISSAGLRVILAGGKRLKGQKGAVILVAPKRAVQEILDISGFTSLFQIYATLAQATVSAGSAS